MMLPTPIRPRLIHGIWLALLAATPAGSLPARAQNPVIIYANSLTNGWLDTSYNCSRNFAGTATVHAGTAAISATITAAYGGIQLYHAPFTNTGANYLCFWLNGGPAGGQHLQIYGNLQVNGSSTAQSSRYLLNPPVTNTWQQYAVPLAALGVANVTNFTGFAIQDSAGTTEPVFYLDDLQLNAAGPALTHLTVNAGLPVRTADARWFGLNSPDWDSYLDTPQTLTLLTNIGTRALRFPGGSESDEYHWLANRTGTNTWTWPASLANFIHVLTNLSGQAMITLNYGTGSSNESAAWVAYANAATTATQALGTDAAGTNWQTAGYWAALRAAAPLKTDDGRNFLRLSRSAPLGFKYWEIGNEVYGSWETDGNSPPHDPYTYAQRAAGYFSLMKAVDPTVRVGVVAVTGEDSYANYTNHAALNSRTGVTHHGWTPVLLATLKNLGVTPDFLIHHRYPENPGSENDASLLQSSAGWAGDAAGLRQLLSDYSGPTGTNTELICTENNSVSSAPGRQSVSLVNGLFLADSLAQMMQTEFNGLFWWDLRNSQETDGNLATNLYGWRAYGSYGIVDATTNGYPVCYTAKLLRQFVQTGDTVLTAASDYSLLSTYAVRRQNGSLTLLTINKDPVNILTGQVTVASFSPAPAATVYAYGIPQDNAAQAGTGSPDLAQTAITNAGTNFTCAYPPYSATVLALSPASARIVAQPFAPAAGQFVFQLQGQAGIPYIIQHSTNLTAWDSVATNIPLTGLQNITNPLTPSSPQHFWRALWHP